MASVVGEGVSRPRGGVRPRTTPPSDPWEDPGLGGPRAEASEVDLCAVFSGGDREKRRVKARPTEEERLVAPETVRVSAFWAGDELEVIAIVEERWYG